MTMCLVSNPLRGCINRFYVLCRFKNLHTKLSVKNIQHSIPITREINSYLNSDFTMQT